MPTANDECVSFCGRPVPQQQFELVAQITSDFRQLALTELAHTVCELLDWRRPNGGLKSRECFLWLQALQQRGLLPWLPAVKPHARRPHQVRVTVDSDPQPPCTGPLGTWRPVTLQLVDSADARKLFQQYVARYHYLGYRVPYGAQLRYFVRSGGATGPVLACLLFTSAAWKMAPRDRYIGWSDVERVRGLARVVSNSRFLVLPWVRIPHLASHVLALAARQVRRDWAGRYGVEPALLETLVDRSRYAGTCYRAANWISLGMTQGRGRMDRDHTRPVTRKEILVFPLTTDWRSRLCTPEPPAAAAAEGEHA